MAAKKAGEMDLDHIWNSDLLHIVDLPRHISKRHNTSLRLKNTTLSTNNSPPVLKNYENDSSGFQDLRLYYRAAIKGFASLKLYQACLLFYESKLALKSSFKSVAYWPLKKNSIPSKRYSINLVIGTVASHSLNEKLLPFEHTDTRVASITSSLLQEHGIKISGSESANRFIQETCQNYSVYDKWYQRAWRRMRSWIRKKVNQMKCPEMGCCPRRMIISIDFTVDIDTLQ